MKECESSATLMKEEKINEVARPENADNHSEKPSKVARDEICIVLVLSGHHWSPDLSCKAPKNCPEYDGAATELVRKRGVEPSARC